jgi:hypothetical protein
MDVGCDGWPDMGAAGPAESETLFSGLIDEVCVEGRTPKPALSPKSPPRAMAQKLLL